MTSEQIAHGVGPDRLDIAYRRHGHSGDPAAVLIMGIAAQLVNWPPEFIRALTDRGLQVIVFDNRDTGRSTHLDSAPADLSAVQAGDLTSVSYTLSDMAADTVGLMDHLGIRAAHLVGASMGGAIAQTIAIEHPDRTLSLSSMMSTTGAPEVGAAHPDVMAALFGEPPVTTREEEAARAIRAATVVRSPAYPPDPAAIARRAGIAYDRSHDIAGITRNAVAVVASGDRTGALRTLKIPTLVIHGRADRMCDPSGGRATAAAIPGAQLELIDGMGHDIPAPLYDRIADLIAENARRSDHLQFKTRAPSTHTP
ncbi:MULTISPECIES: alpha/beta fold hydrolase [Mycolicibacterium]|jgi:pimeloyl-ACP methyl ester carboxylesterase|uniref:alpha/beta fold hydrolase n=1 Tax=Mycolicibacterium TaxID=1866885 RepID=UPI00298C6CF2|nr:alpha/beta hydrolase [Mycolicibacterium sp. D5.8-2]MDW5610091.1 alpha/beta hydrolase [Mycolicibacterium sp. D5.8-2]